MTDWMQPNKESVGVGPVVAGDEPEPPEPEPATGATAGSPGSWTPAGSTPPATFAGLASVTASPAAALAPGQYVVLGDASEAHWTGTAWAVGRAPAAEEPEA